MYTQLQAAVLDQLGIDPEQTLDEDCKGMLEDVARHGASAGWVGFTYYSDTTAFWKNNRLTILKGLNEQSEDCGLSTVDMVVGFRCLNGDYTQHEVLAVLVGLEENTQIENALAWWALEEVAYQLTD